MDLNNVNITEIAKSMDDYEEYAEKVDDEGEKEVL